MTRMACDARDDNLDEDKELWWEDWLRIVPSQILLSLLWLWWDWHDDAHENNDNFDEDKVDCETKKLRWWIMAPIFCSKVLHG